MQSDSTYKEKAFSVENITALITIFIVATTALYLMYLDRQVIDGPMLLTGVMYLTFAVFWHFAISERTYKHDVEVRLVLIVLQYAVTIYLFFLVPFTYTAILVTIWGAQLPYYISFKQALWSSPIWSSPMWLIHTYYWGDNYALLSAMLFWTFNVFTLVMINATLKEQRAREATNEINRELMATQALLHEATKQAERVRIARNIHDLLGHHLTALTINLQVASRISNDEAKNKIEECHGLAKLLLSDVREAVSEIREKSNIQLQLALQKLVESVPELAIELNYQDGVNIGDVSIAETVLRCVQESVTNSLKHSNGDKMKISLEVVEDGIRLTMLDNGRQKESLKMGNGLRGMTERVKELGGQIDFSSTSSGFSTVIQLPEAI